MALLNLSVLAGIAAAIAAIVAPVLLRDHLLLRRSISLTAEARPVPAAAALLLLHNLLLRRDIGLAAKARPVPAAAALLRLLLGFALLATALPLLTARLDLLRLNLLLHASRLTALNTLLARLLVLLLALLVRFGFVVLVVGAAPSTMVLSQGRRRRGGREEN